MNIEFRLNCRIRGRAVITAGGTYVKKDGARVEANLSRGSFGVAKANAFAERGVPVTLIISKMCVEGKQIHPDVEVITFGDYYDYVEKLKYVAMKYDGKIAYAISAAAVSDFRPAETLKTKRSSKRGYTLRYVPLPKVIALWRGLFGKICYIVVFKLVTSETGLAELAQKTMASMKVGHANLGIGNYAPWGDNPRVGKGEKECWLMKPDGGRYYVKGTNELVARAIVDFILVHADTTWMQSERVGSLGKYAKLLHRPGPADVLRLAQGAGIIHDASGNVIVRDTTTDDLRFWATLRGVPKASLKPHDLTLVSPRFVHGTNLFWSRRQNGKPSSDAAVYGRVLAFSNAYGFIHGHGMWSLRPDAVTNRDFPCGSAEEAGEILSALGRGNRGDGKPVMIELTGHGHTVVLFDHDTVRRFGAQWERLRGLYEEHLNEVGLASYKSDLHLSPVWDGAEMVGVCAKHTKKGWHAFFLDEAARKRGLGHDLLALIDEREVMVAVGEGCKVEEYYVNRGFRVVERQEDGIAILEPPSLRKDVGEAAAVHITAKSTGRKVVGQRADNASTYAKKICNGGGHIEEVDDANPRKRGWAAATRELLEEFGIDLRWMPEPRWSMHYAVTVDMEGRQRVTRVQVFHVDLEVEVGVRANLKEFSWAGWVAREELEQLIKEGKVARATQESWRVAA